jgi:hypothetical protein
MFLTPFVTSNVYDIYVDACKLPVAESSASAGWSASDPTTHNFTQTLTPPDFNTSFTGRLVDEANVGGDGPDTCYDPTSAYAPMVDFIPTGQQLTVQSNQTWSYDRVGWSSLPQGNLPDPISYYRARGRAPCDTTVFQKMLMDCGNVFRPYVQQTHKEGFDTTTVFAERAGVRVTRSWP